MLGTRPWSLEQSRLQPLLVLHEETATISPSRGPSETPRVQPGWTSRGLGQAGLPSPLPRAAPWCV